MILFGPGLGAGYVVGSIAALVGVPEHDSGLAGGVTTAVTGFRAAFAAGVVFAVVGLVASVALLRQRKQALATVAQLPSPGRRRDAA